MKVRYELAVCTNGWFEVQAFVDGRHELRRHVPTIELAAWLMRKPLKDAQRSKVGRT